MIAHNPVALTRNRLQPGQVDQRNLAARVPDETLLLQMSSDHRHARPRDTQHVRHVLMRQWQHPVPHSIRTQQQPPSHPLLHAVMRIATRRLRRLNKLRLQIPQRQIMKLFPTLELFRRHSHHRRIPVAANLHIYPIETPARSHHARCPENRLRPGQRYLHLEPVLERHRHRRDALFNEEQIRDATPRKFNLPAHRQFNPLQFQPINHLWMKLLKNNVLEGLHTHEPNFLKAWKTYPPQDAAVQAILRG